MRVVGYGLPSGDKYEMSQIKGRTHVSPKCSQTSYVARMTLNYPELRNAKITGIRRVLCSISPGFRQCWGVKSGFSARYSGILPIKPHSHPQMVKPYSI